MLMLTCSLRSWHRHVHRPSSETRPLDLLQTSDQLGFGVELACGMEYLAAMGVVVKTLQVRLHNSTRMPAHAHRAFTRDPRTEFPHAHMYPRAHA